MTDLFPIFIPSKGRPGCATARHLLKLTREWFVVVEPQEQEAYAAEIPSDCLLLLPEDNQGLVYVRNWILARVRQRGLGWFWMLDDDITRFFKVANKKCVPLAAAKALEGAQQLFAEAKDLAQAALEYQQFAWSAQNPFRKNGYCDVAVCIHAERSKPIAYRPEMVLKEDRDFTLQLLANGWNTLRCQRYAFAAPKNGSNAGGLQEMYRQRGREAQASRRMAAAWGEEICRPVIKPDGRPDVAVNWAYFKR